MRHSVASRRVTALADRYTGRHIRATRRGAWVSKRRSRQSRQLLPAAAAMTVAGLLVGGAGTVINSGAPVAVGTVPDNGPNLDDANAAPDRAASADRVSRATPRPTATPTATPTPT